MTLLPTTVGISPHGAEVVLLDGDGVIVAVNEAWSLFTEENGGDPTRSGVGTSYLAACDAADDPASRDMSAGIEQRWRETCPHPGRSASRALAPVAARLDVLISSRLDESGQSIGATVTLYLAAWPDVDPEASGTPEELLDLELDLGGHGLADTTAVLGGGVAGELTFADVPRLHLDQLLEQLTADAQRVLSVQGRLRALLRATAVVASDLSLPVVLRQIVEAARDW